jgi:glycosyltransferase involved in cell wall biosynthesis
MKILLAHNFYRSSAPSGEDSAYRNERRLLERHFTIIPYERFNDDIDDSTLVKRVDLALAGAWSRRTYDEVSALIRKCLPDVAHFHNTFPLISPSAYAACRDAGVPVVQTLHNFRLVCPQAMLLRNGRPCEHCLNGNFLPALGFRCYRDSFIATLAQVHTQSYNRYRGTYRRLVNRFITLTGFASEKFIKAGFSTHRLTVVPNTLIDQPSAGGGDGGYALFVGRLSAEKGIRVLLEAWSDIDIPLKIVGDGPLRPELEAIVRTRALKAEFTGHLDRENVLGLVQRAMLQVVPSECYEGFPMVLLEAMACGTPVVASRIGSLNEIVLDGITGIKFSPGNAGELEAAVKGLVSEPERLASMRIRARDHFERKYAPSGHVTKLAEIYRDVIQEMKIKAAGHGTSKPSRS